MHNLNTVELKAFIPAKDFEISKQFYTDLGFTKSSDSEDIAYFCQGNCSFLLQYFYEQKHADNFMMHLLVEDIKELLSFGNNREALSRIEARLRQKDVLSILHDSVRVTNKKI